MSSEQNASLGAERKPGSKWRILAIDGTHRIELSDKGVFDELVIDDWFHLEQMDERRWWMRVGDARVWIGISEGGTATLDIERGCYEQPTIPNRS